MRLLIINTVCGIKSTGRIAASIAEEYEKKGYEVKIAYGREGVPAKFKRFAVRIGSDLNSVINAAACRILDNDGFFARKATKRFLKWASEFNPDVVWLHNLHGYYINVELLFSWIKSRENLSVFWTLHDCWAFTGHCSYYTFRQCDKWKRLCEKCPQKKEYPASFFLDRSQRNFKKKQNSFLGVKNMTIVTPSRWLANEAKKSFLGSYNIIVVPNTIDTKVFSNRADNNIKKRLCISGKTMILGVAAQWQARKGFYDFIKLSRLLPDSFQIVLIGVTKKQKKMLPSNIIAIERTSNPEELAMYYSAADVFINPTYEDNYPTTNLEARACGTPVITYNVGGSPESVDKKNVVQVGDIGAIYSKIINGAY